MSAFERFLEPYQAVRRAEGWGTGDAAYYLNLPHVAAGDPQRPIWQVRAASFRALLRVLGVRRRVLDVGAGNGWLAYQLARRGHSVAALDLNDDSEDGLGAFGHYPLALEAYRADFAALPFADARFDAVVFGASLHYAPALAPVIAEGLRVLAWDGMLIVMDSPVYQDAASGRAMLAEKQRGLRERFNLDLAPGSLGFLTFGDFENLGRTYGLRWRRVEPYVSAAWSMRHLRARLRGRREPAHFGLTIGERDVHPQPTPNAIDRGNVTECKGSGVYSQQARPRRH